MPQQTTKKSTLFRMIYLHQPIAGLLTKTSQLFSGRVNRYYASVSGRRTTPSKRMLPSAFKQNQAAVPGWTL